MEVVWFLIFIPISVSATELDNTAWDWITTGIVIVVFIIMVAFGAYLHSKRLTRQERATTTEE